MVNRKTAFLAAFIIVAAAVAGAVLFQSETKKVKKSFSRLADWGSKKGDENLLTLAQKAKNIGTLFAGKCEFKTPVAPFSGTLSPEEVSGYAMKGRSLFSTLDLRFYDMTVTFPEKDVAEVDLTLMLKAFLTNGEAIEETHEIACVLKKVEKKWVFSRFEVVEVLKK